MLHVILHVALRVALCIAPALVLLPVWHLDRGPSNEIVHEQDPDGQEDGRAEVRAAA